MAARHVVRGVVLPLVASIGDRATPRAAAFDPSQYEASGDFGTRCVV